MLIVNKKIVNKNCKCSSLVSVAVLNTDQNQPGEERLSFTLQDVVNHQEKLSQELKTRPRYEPGREEQKWSP